MSEEKTIKTREQILKKFKRIETLKNSYERKNEQQLWFMYDGFQYGLLWVLCMDRKTLKEMIKLEYKKKVVS
jgi:hypothetical protein